MDPSYVKQAADASIYPDYSCDKIKHSVDPSIYHDYSSVQNKTSRGLFNLSCITSFCGHRLRYHQRMAFIISQIVVDLVKRELSAGRSRRHNQP